MPEWSQYQNEVAGFFRLLALEAETNQQVDGARSVHNVDVVVRSRHAGLEVLWLVECKHWKTRITKEKVFALRTIVDDTGADRGFIMAENGFQSGAIEAACYANVMLSSLRELGETLAFEIGKVKLQSIDSRIVSCAERYWAISKTDRIRYNLRQDVFSLGYSGAAVIKAVESTLHRAAHRGFPISYNRSKAALAASIGPGIYPDDPDDESVISTPSQLYNVLHEEMSLLESRLGVAEAALQTRSQQK